MEPAVLRTAISVSDCTVRALLDGPRSGGGSRQGSLTKVFPPRPLSWTPGVGLLFPGPWSSGPSLGPNWAAKPPAERRSAWHWPLTRMLPSQPSSSSFSCAATVLPDANSMAAIMAAATIVGALHRLLQRASSFTSTSCGSRVYRSNAAGFPGIGGHGHVFVPRISSAFDHQDVRSKLCGG